MNLETVKTELEKNKLFDYVQRVELSEDEKEYRIQIVLTKNNVKKLYDKIFCVNHIEELKNDNDEPIESVIINIITNDIQKYINSNN